MKSRIARLDVLRIDAREKISRVKKSFCCIASIEQEIYNLRQVASLSRGSSRHKTSKGCYGHDAVSLIIDPWLTC